MSAVWIAVIAISLLGLIFGLILGYASRRFAVQDDPVVEKIDELLPQSQCGQCGYPGCRPYAEAVGVQGEKINRCAPGGEAVMLKIAALLNVDPQPVDGASSYARGNRRAELHWLYQVYPGLSGGCHRWGDPRHAYRDERPVHRLQFVRRPLPDPVHFTRSGGHHPGDLEMGSAYDPGAQYSCGTTCLSYFPLSEKTRSGISTAVFTRLK